MKNGAGVFQWFSIIPLEHLAPFPFTQGFYVFYDVNLRIDNLTFISNESIVSETNSENSPLYDMWRIILIFA